MDNFNPEQKGVGYFINREKYLDFHEDLFGSGIDIEKKANNLILEQIGGNFLVFFIAIFHKKSHFGRVRLLGTEELKHEIQFQIERSIMEEPALTGEIKLLPSDRLGDELLTRVTEINTGVPEKFLCVPYFPSTSTYAPLLCCVMDVCDQCACSVISTPPPVSSELVERQQSIVATILDVFRYCGCSVALSMMYDAKRLECEQGDSLLQVADSLFSKIDNVSGVLRHVMTEMRRLTHAERCSLFLVDKANNALVAKVFDDEKIADVELPLDRGIVGRVAKTGAMMNVKNVYGHTLFFKDIDEITGFTTRAVLCVPILSDHEVIAVAELCNKEKDYGDFFTITDEQTAQNFASYCGICIKHTILYQKATVAKARQNITNELMMYHLRMQVLEDEVNQVLMCRLNHRKVYNYTEYRYSAWDIDNEHTPCVLLEMFKDLRLLSMYQIPDATFIRCMLYFKKGYRDLPYHNWSHAMSVVHFGYALVRNLKLVEQGYLQQLEVLAFLIACIGHDVDHRGTTNAYQNHAQTALASLYSSEGSVMEHHHFNQTVLILSLDDCNVLEKLTKEEYLRVLDWIRYLILATDLAHHLHRQSSIRKRVQNYNKEKISHKRALLSVMISCSDLSCAAKEWTTTRRIAEHVYQEFFTEGDLAARLGYSPGSLMCRTTAKIPEQQISFLQRVCIPVFSTLELLFPETDELVNIISQNIEFWDISQPFFEVRQERGQDALDILSSPEFEKEVIKEAKRRGIDQNRGRRPRMESKMIDLEAISHVKSKIVTTDMISMKKYDECDSPSSFQSWTGKDPRLSPASDFGLMFEQGKKKQLREQRDSSQSKSSRRSSVHKQTPPPDARRDNPGVFQKHPHLKQTVHTKSYVPWQHASKPSRHSSIVSWRPTAAAANASSTMETPDSDSSNESRCSNVRFKSRKSY